MKKSMTRSRGRIPAHYIVGPNGEFEKIMENEGKNVGATQKEFYNDRAIQIEIIGDFNKNTPKDKQYATTKMLKDWIFEKYGPLEVLRHGPTIDAKNCPGKLFDMDRLGEIKTPDRKLLFNISRYYSPTENQKQYFSTIPGYYSQATFNKYPRYTSGHALDVCMNCGCNQETFQLYDCEMPASNGKLKAIEAGRAVACPKEFAFGTKFKIDGYGTVYCRDRGGAINIENGTIRLDLWMGYGDEGFNNIRNGKGVAGKRYGTKL